MADAAQPALLGILAMGLTIDAVGPISDNACNIAEVSQMNEWIEERPDVPDAARQARSLCHDAACVRDIGVERH